MKRTELANRLTSRQRRRKFLLVGGGGINERALGKKGHVYFAKVNTTVYTVIYSVTILFSFQFTTETLIGISS